jgi:hypothetical protein
MLYKRQGIERVAEQLLAYQEGLFFLLLIFINYNYFDSYNGESAKHFGADPTYFLYTVYSRI